MQDVKSESLAKQTTTLTASVSVFTACLASFGTLVLRASLLQALVVWFPVTLLLLIVTAIAFYERLARRSLPVGCRPDSGRHNWGTNKRMASLSIFLWLELLCSGVGALMVYKGQTVSGLLILLFGAVIVSVHIILMFRERRKSDSISVSEATDPFTARLILSLIFAIAITCATLSGMLIGVGKIAYAVVGYIACLALIVPTLVVTVRSIRSGESLLATELRIFRTSNTAFGASSAMVICIITGFAIIFGADLWIYGVVLLLCAVGFWGILSRESRRFRNCPGRWPNR